MLEFAGNKILIVDDDPAFRLMLSQFLKKNKFDVCQAEDGMEAIERFESEYPDMVLMDAEMPVMNGIDACRRIREIDPDEHSPVLMITARDDDEFIYRAFDAGAADYVTKPIQWAVLGQRIKYKLKASRAVHMLKESEERFRLLFQKSPLSYQSLDSEGRLIEVNDAWLDMLGYEKDQVLNRPFVDFLCQEEKENFMSNFLAFKKRGDVSNINFRMLNSKGEEIDVEFNGRIGNDIHGAFKQTYCTFQNITRRKEMEAELRRLAATDPLTGLNNRRSFFERANHMRLQCVRYNHPFSILMLDIDYFKLINDRFGHDIGDDVLKIVSDIISQSLREVDVLGRLGGEEFAVLLPETSLKSALKVAERIRASVEAFRLETDQGSVDVKISIGVVGGTFAEESIEVFLKRADEQLYRAKENGRNRIESEAQA